MNKIATSVLFLAVNLCSCIHSYYVPNVQNVPLFREKNEYHFSGTYGLGDESSSYEVQGAYSVTRNFGIMSNYLWAKGIDNHEESWAKGNYIDVAIGYYKQLRKSGVFEIYGGVGGSRQHHQYRIEDFDPLYPPANNFSAGESELSSIKLFVQPSVGLTFNAFEFAFSTRFNSLSFIKIDNQIIGSLNSYAFDKLNTIVQDKNFLFFEPALTIRGGWKNVKVQLQGATASYLNNGKWPFDQYHLSIGLSVSFAKRFMEDVP